MKTWTIPALALIASGLIATPAQARSRQKLALILPPMGETSQLSDDDAEALHDAIQGDLADPLEALGYTVFTDDNAKQIFRKKRIKPDAVNGAKSLKELSKALKLDLLIVCVATSGGRKHVVAIQAINARKEDSLFATTAIQGKSLRGLKSSWSRKREAFIDMLKGTLGKRHRRGGSADEEVQERIAKQSTKDLKKLCDGGLADACTARGYLYQTGDGVRKNRTVAAGLYQKGCDKGDGVGCALLATMYHYGDGVDQDDAQAVKLMKVACKEGYDKACDGGRATDKQSQPENSY